MIKWNKAAGGTLIGKVGDVECYHIIKTPAGFELICELPEAVPNLPGRYTTTHKTVERAAVHAAQTLKHWRIRFEKQPT